MFTQKEGGTTSLADLKEQAKYVMHGIAESECGGLRELGMSHVIEAAVRDDNSYDLLSLETIWWADWMLYGKIGYTLKTGKEL